MPFEILECAIQKIFDWQKKTGGPVSINWNAGEPLTAKIDFYAEACAYINKYNQDKVDVVQSIQTNGTLMTEAWGEFLSENNFFVTVSVDGPAFIHDQSRVNWKGKSSHSLVQAGIGILRRYQKELHGICVLTNTSLDHPDEIFDYFQENGFASVGFNIEEKEGYNTYTSFEKNTATRDRSVERYTAFLRRISELSVQSKSTLKIREIDTIRQKLTHLYHSEEKKPVHNQQNIPLQIVSIGRTGNLYTFSPEMTGGDAINPDAYVVGNIRDISSFSDILKNSNFIKLNQEIQTGVEMCRETCEYFAICGGGAPMNKISENGTFASTETTYCVLSKKAVADLFMHQWATHGLR